MLCAILSACGKKERQPAASGPGTPPTAIAPISGADAARMQAEGKANDLGFCLAALEAEAQGAAGGDPAMASTVQEQLKKIAPQVDAVNSRKDSATTSFQTQYDTMKGKLGSRQQCGNLQCSDPVFRQYVIKSSCSP